MKIILVNCLAWIGLAVVAIANGVLRVKGYAPYMSELAAHQISTFVGIGLFGVFFWFLTGFFPLASSRQALALGVLWLVMTISFEFIFGHFVAGHSWTKVFADYNIFEGRLWILILLWTTFGPYIFYRIRT